MDDNNKLMVIDVFTIKEIEYVLTSLLDKPEVDEFIIEFNKFKYNKIILPEPEPIKKYDKILVELSDKEVCKWVNDLSGGRNGYGPESEALFAYPPLNKDYKEPAEYVHNSQQRVFRYLSEGYVFITKEEFNKHILKKETNNEKAIQTNKTIPF